IVVNHLVVRTGDLALAAEGTLARSRAERPLEVRVDGELKALQPWVSAFDVDVPPFTGTVALHARVDGTLDAPRPTASLTLRRATVDVRGAPLQLPALQASLADGLVTVSDTRLMWRDAQATFSGRAPLRMLRTYLPEAAHDWLGDAQDAARLDARATDLQPGLLEPFVGADALDGISGRVSATLAAEATEPSLAGVEATLTLDEAEVTPP